MQIITGTVRGGRIVLSDNAIGATTSHDHAALHLTLDDAWDGTALTAQFCDAHGGAVTLTLSREQDGTLLVPIPAEATRYAGVATFTLRGVLADAETETFALALASCDLVVLESGWDADAEAAAQPDATIAVQLQQQIDGKISLSEKDAAGGVAALGSNRQIAFERLPFVRAITGSDNHVPSSRAVNAALAGKVDKVAGKGLSTNDYTDAEKHENKSVLDAITAAVVAAGQRLLSLFASITSVVTALGADDTTIPTSKAVADALAAKVSNVVAIGPSEQEESIVDENGVAHVPMVVSKTSEKRPGMVRTWSERYASAATDAGVLVAQPKTVAQFYEQAEGEDVVHENAFVAKGTLRNLMGNPQGAALIATKDEVAAVKMQYVTTLTASSPTNLLAVDLTQPLREVFCYISAIGGANSSGNVALRFKNGEASAGRTIGTLAAGVTKTGVAKFFGACPGIKVLEKTTLTETQGIQKASDYYVFSGGMPNGEVTRIELAAAASGNTFAVGTKLVICGVRA